jgi:hypothetical protein
MVQDSGKTLRSGAYKSVNLPEALEVSEDSEGRPLEINLPPRQKVASIEDRWRIDDEWWRVEAISRMYYAVLFRSGQKLVVFKDLLKNEWFKQVY